MKRIVICGARDWTNVAAIEARIMFHKCITHRTAIIEGGAPGADRIAGDLAKRLGLPHIRVEANWLFYKKAAGPRRNRWMLDLEPDMVLAFHSDIESSKGTKDCITEAYRRKIPYELNTNDFYQS